MLKEQMYKNLNKEYYHGYRVLNPALKTCEEFYLTQSFIYAASYAGPKGSVDVFKLNRNANIFNLNCETDFKRLQAVADLNLNELKDRDWFSYFKGDLKERRKLLDLIENLGYDEYLEVINYTNSIKVSLNLTLSKKFPELKIISEQLIKELDNLDNNIRVYNSTAENENWSNKIIEPKEAKEYLKKLYSEVDV